MIEAATYPVDLDTWDPDTTPFYFEVYGETSPTLDVSYAEVLPAGPQNGGALQVSSSPIYEYWWTIGHPGHPHETGHIFRLTPDTRSIWNELEDPAARVYLFFPHIGGWRIKELVATVKYLSPAHDPTSTTQHLLATAGAALPYLDDASKIAGLLPIPGVSTASTILGALAKLQINNIPQNSAFPWSVGKVTYHSKDHGVMHGVMWTLPRSMFTELGGRLTGSLALSIIPTSRQSPGAVSTQTLDLQQLPLRAHAVVYGPKGRETWAPPKSDFVSLQLQPHLPDTREPPAG